MRQDGAVESLRGKLLIAGPELWDPNFRRTIVLIGHHDDEGAVGVVLNRVAEVTVEEAVPPLAELVPDGERLFLGGPVQPEAAVVLAEFEEPERAETLAFGSIGFLAGEVDPEEVGPIRRARVYAGYAGWGPGQLEAEIEEASWILEPALSEDVFAPDPETLWSLVLRRKGPGFRFLLSMPVDPTAN
ncbi:MAG: YqgE/AlgH family protein [Actinobacteria bacterium]|nr:YqgE/AlgH family protein [Actinomycetota bacterium]